MNRKKVHTDRSSRTTSFVGRVLPRKGRMRPGEFEIEVRLLENSEKICRAPVDGNGRFIVRHRTREDLKGKAVEFTVYDSSGLVASKQIGVFPTPGVVEAIAMPIDKSVVRGTTKTLQDPKLPPLKPWEIVSVRRRAHLAERLKGKVREQDGRPLVPHWINDSIAALNIAGKLAWMILHGDETASSRFLSLISSRKPGAPARLIDGMGFGGSFDIPRRRRLTDSIPGRISGRYHPCVFDFAPVMAVAGAGLYLDIFRAEKLGDLTQPGAYTEQTVKFVKMHHQALAAFSTSLADYDEGILTREVFESLVHGDSVEAEGIPLLLPGEWKKEIHFGSSQPGLPIPGSPFDPPRIQDLSCDLWVDCVDEIADFASNYRPLAACPADDIIGSITPSTVCLGTTDVEIEIRPRQGQTFSFAGSGAPCLAYIQRSFNRRRRLEVINTGEQLVKVRLAEASWSGCIGFRGAVNYPANIGFIDTCMKMGGIKNSYVAQLITARTNPLLIDCTGDNQLTVVPPPRVDHLHTSNTEDLHCSKPEGGSTSHSKTLTHNAEACTPVCLSWRFDHDGHDSWVDPSTFIKVGITKSDGSPVDDDLPNEGQITVIEREDEAYTLTAVAQADGDECGRVEALITIGRFHEICLSGPNRLQGGQTATLEVRISCPALAGGLEVFLSTNQPDSLLIPDRASILEGNDHATVEISAVGSICVEADISATAEGHVSGGLEVEVYDDPVIQSITPPTVSACREFELDISGRCFLADDTTSVHARKSDGTERTLEITDISETYIRCTVAEDELMPGSWRVFVVSRELESNERTLEVEVAPPSFDFFLVVPGAFHSGDCRRVVTIDWAVSDAVRVELHASDQGFIWEQSIDEDSECGMLIEGSYLDYISTDVEYQLYAYPAGGGSPVFEERSANFDDLPDLFSVVRIYNGTDLSLVIWKVEGHLELSDISASDEIPKHDLDPEDEVTLNLNDCAKYTLLAIDKQSARDENKDPYGDAVETGSFIQWHKRVTGKDGQEEWYYVLTH